VSGGIASLDDREIDDVALLAQPPATSGPSRGWSSTTSNRITREYRSHR
jgi:hypothetical protein